MKITDEQFFAALRESAGLYARASRIIEKEYGVSYTRQSVKERAERHPEILKDIESENHDIAEEGLHSLMRSKNERIRFQSVQFYLKTKGKDRGYVERSEIHQETTYKSLDINIIDTGIPLASSEKDILD